jgi:Lon protease-like protein
VGQVVRSSRQEGGTYHITVEGRVRARLREVSSPHPYRRVEAVALPDTQSWLAEREGTGILRRILEAAGRAGIAQAEDAPIRLPRSVERRAALLNLLASSVLADPGERQAMLVADVPERAELLLRQLRIAGDLLAALGRTPPPRDPRVN